jgi:hypothetical protein
LPEALVLDGREVDTHLDGDIGELVMVEEQSALDTRWACPSMPSEHHDAPGPSHSRHLSEPRG